MRKRILALTLVIMLAILSFGYCSENNWGETDTDALLRKVAPSYLVLAGRDLGGSVSIASTVTAIPLTYSVVRRDLNYGVGQVNTIANGSPGQLLTIYAGARTGSDTAVLTPSTCTGFTTITLDAALEYATLQYIDSTIGWIIVGTNGTIA